MSRLQIQERFAVAASPAHAFEFLLEPHSLVGCLPGAELEEVESERSFTGRVTVKVGAVKIVYRGRIELLEVHASGQRLHARGEGREAGGAGKVKVELRARVEAAEPGNDGATVEVEADIDLAGKIVRFGRGMIQSVSKQLFGEFAACVQRCLEPSEEAAAPAAPEPDASGPAQPIRGFSLLLRALRDWLRSLFRRSA